MRRWVSGNGENPLSTVANHTLLLLAARCMAVVGPAVAGYLFLQLADGLKAQQAETAALRELVWRQISGLSRNDAVQDSRLSDHDRRLSALEPSRRP